MPKAARPVSTTIPTRMGLAVPSLAEASRRLPSSVKADPASADDVLVTSVAIPPAIDEAVSPELALVDPELRERLRALLPEIELELEPPPPLLRAVPDPEPDEALPLAPPPELVGSSDHAAVAPSGAAAGARLRLSDTRGAVPVIREGVRRWVRRRRR